jgi:formylglycine-generating enzyme required for sulfatase activity
MVGNVEEWVQDWVPLSTACPGWSGGFSGDFMCLAGADTTDGPGALVRGGSFGGGSTAGPFGVGGSSLPWLSLDFIGFRCAR